jgi:opacity protein-like surface antigen
MSFKFTLTTFTSVAILITGYTSISNAQQSSDSLVPNSGTYAGVGVGVSSTQFNGQTLSGTGLTTDTVAGRSASGIGSGETGVVFGPVKSISPSVQLGYFKKFEDSNYLWGTKLSYSYIGGSPATTYNVQLPQYGTFPNGKPLTGGNAVTSSYQKSITNQISLIPYFGKALEKGMIYFGVGPTYSQVRSTTNGLVGYAQIDGRTVDVSGAPQSFISSQWVYGGAAMIGGSYFIDKNWFLDLSYSYAMTQNKTSNRVSPFSNPPTTGFLIGSSTGTATVQTIGLTLNKLF